jgi:HEAT repeat protein
VLPYVGHADAFVRAAALRGLRELRVPESDAPALNALHDTDATVRREAVAVLGWRKQVAALPALAERARGDTDADVRRAATGALGLATDATVLPALLDALRDPAWRVREESASTLGKLRALAPEADVTHALVETLADGYWQVRLQAARALGRWRAAHAIETIVTLLAHPISNLRKEAALALGEIADTAALPTLRLAETDGDPEVVKAVRIAVAQIEGSHAAA